MKALALSCPVALALVLGAGVAQAETIIEYDSDAPDYKLEIEPHGVLAPWPAPYQATGGGVGAGLRVGINLLERGFLPSVNDSVALGVGGDWVYYGAGPATTGTCAEWSGTGNERYCVRVAGSAGAAHYLYLPGAMQWNFYITDGFSAFGEPGAAFILQFRELDNSMGFSFTPTFHVGGRWHFSKKTTLTFRIGYPYATVGVSFML